MSKYTFHYQQIKHSADNNDPYKVHEAYSIGGAVVMINPKPIQLVGATKEELEELVCMVERDVVRYGVLTMKEAQRAMQAYHDSMYSETVPAMAMYEDEDDLEDDCDYLDDDDKVIPIDEYFKRML